MLERENKIGTRGRGQCGVTEQGVATTKERRMGRTAPMNKSRDVRERIQDDTVKGDAQEIRGISLTSQNSMSYEAPAVVASV